MDTLLLLLAPFPPNAFQSGRKNFFDLLCHKSAMDGIRLSSSDHQASFRVICLEDKQGHEPTLTRMNNARISSSALFFRTFAQEALVLMSVVKLFSYFCFYAASLRLKILTFCKIIFVNWSIPLASHTEPKLECYSPSASNKHAFNPRVNLQFKLTPENFSQAEEQSMGKPNSSA